MKPRAPTKLTLISRREFDGFLWLMAGLGFMLMIGAYTMAFLVGNAQCKELGYAGATLDITMAPHCYMEPGGLKRNLFDIKEDRHYITGGGF